MGKLACVLASVVAFGQFGLSSAEEACGSPDHAAGAALLSARVMRERVAGLSSEINESVTDILRDTLQQDANDTSKFPDAEANTTHNDSTTGLGGLSKPFEFLYAKVAELEAAVQLQNAEIKVLSSRLDEKSEQVAALIATVQLHAQLPDHGQHDPEQLEHHVARARASARTAHEKHRKQVSKMQKAESIKILRAVMGKHAHQHRHGFKHPPDANNTSDPEPMPSDVKKSLEMRAGLIERGAGDTARELDTAVSAKDPFGALSDAYNEATDQVSFVANTVIDTVEAAMAILLNGFDMSAGCPDSKAPSASADVDGVKIDFGRQRCEITLVGQKVELFDFNFGDKSFKWWGPLATLAKLGSAIAGCASGGGTDALVCFAKILGNTLLNGVPPFSFLAKLDKIMEEFIEVFALMAGKLIEKAVGDSTSLIQEAVQTKFPDVGAAAVVKKYSKSLELRLSSRHGPKHTRPVEAKPSADASLLQSDRSGTESLRGDDDTPEGALGFGAADYVPQVHKLITQFNGVETDSGSCLAFAPSVRNGPGNTVQPRDWQTPGPQSNVPQEFIKLEPWAVPCGNDWMKQNPGKWEGYSFYTWEAPVERCTTVVYSLSLQPVIAFVGGLEFDIMPAPIAEVETLVCWPDTQPGGVDLSAIEMHIKSGGVPLLTRTMRLKKRFGSGNTDFSGSNIKASSASGMMNFGVPEDGADDSALNVMSRDSLLQATVNASAKPGVHADLEDFEFEIEKSSYLASMEYDMLRGANNVTAAWHGGEADRRLQPLFPRSPSLVESDDQATNTEHILFSLQSPNTGLVGFEVLGILNNHRLQLSLQLQFGPFTTPRKRYTIMDLKSQLAAILAAIPFISPTSKATAVQAMTDFDALAANEVPRSSVPMSSLEHYWIFTSQGHRVTGRSLFWDNGPQEFPFSQDPSTAWRLLPDGLGEYWLVTGDGQQPAGHMVYLADDGNFESHVFWEDPKTKWKLNAVPNSDEFWLVTGPNHHEPGKMLFLTSSGWSTWSFSHDTKCKFRVMEVAPGLQPFMLKPAEVWMVGAEGHRTYQNDMLFWKEGDQKIYGFNYDGSCRWILKPAPNGEYWLITGSQADEPNAMFFIRASGFKLWAPAWDDPACTWRIIDAGDGTFWLATSPNHHDPNRMLYMVGGEWATATFWHDPQTKFRFLLN